jgi:tetratricopeptide (TPR) repeat protein
MLSDTSYLYRKAFLVKVGVIKGLYRQGQIDAAIKKLKAMDDQILLPSEKSLRRNLLGVLQFSDGNYEQSIFNFDLALANSSLDKALTAQIYLNLSSSYFKLGLMEKAYATLTVADHKVLKVEEAKKYHKLRIKLAKELNKDSDLLFSLVRYLGRQTDLTNLKQDPYFEQLLSSYFQMGARERLRFIEEFEDDNLLIIGYLGYLEVEKLYYSGNKHDAKDLLGWLKSNFEKHVSVTQLADNFSYRMENFVKMNPYSIGVILPMSGKKLEFSKRAMLGIDSGLNELKKENADFSNLLRIHIKDSEGSGVVGAYKVKELIEKHNVSAIIGGLFANEAQKEYLEAKKHGVFFISLSQIYLPKEQKDHLLLEIPGSVESLIGRLFSPEMLERFGKRAAIIYPKSERGEAYVNEFWRMSKQNDVSITGALGFEKNQTDYRDPVKKMLGLKYIRERQEELDILTEIHSLEKATSSRRVQTLKPQIDFDWIFLPAFPKEAIQLIPSFAYYDAYNLNFVGGPSWRSHSLSKESKKIGKLFFIGDDVKGAKNNFSSNFYNLYKKRPRLIELRSHDAFKIVSTLLAEDSFSSRDEFDFHIQKQNQLTGITGNWNLLEGIWLKKMVSLSLRRGKVENIFSNVNLVPRKDLTSPTSKSESMSDKNKMNEEDKSDEIIKNL